MNRVQVQMNGAPSEMNVKKSGMNSVSVNMNEVQSEMNVKKARMNRGTSCPDAGVKGENARRVWCKGVVAEVHRGMVEAPS